MTTPKSTLSPRGSRVRPVRAGAPLRIEGSVWSCSPDGAWAGRLHAEEAGQTEAALSWAGDTDTYLK